LDEWTTAVSSAATPSLLVDTDCIVLAISKPAADLFATRVTRALGRSLLDLVTLVDFGTGASTYDYAARIPPVAAARGGAITRGLFRIDVGDRTVTVDAIASPLYDDTREPVGSISFLADIADTLS
jgi:hypothetical protein